MPGPVERLESSRADTLTTDLAPQPVPPADPGQPPGPVLASVPPSDPVLPPDLDALTGIRSSKPTFYAEYRRTADNLARSVQALDRISQVLVATGHGPERLCREVVRAAADHLGAESVVLALAPGVLPDAAPRFVAADLTASTIDDATVLPDPLADQLADLRAGVAPVLLADSGLLVVPLSADGQSQGMLAAWLGSGDSRAARVPVPDSDLAVLRILANQALSALQSSDLLRRSEQLRSRSERLYESASTQARDLAERNAELHQAQQRLDAARQRQAMDDERHRLARELHDSVAQHVVSAGMAIEWCRGEITEGPVREKLDTAKSLARVATDRLRSAIFALSSDQADAEQGLPELLHGLRALHDQTRFDLRVRVEGRPVRLSPQVEHSLFQIASEGVFNTAVHADASRAQVRLTYQPDSLRLTVSDDGNGSPETLRRVVRGQVPGTASGYHRGLGNIVARAQELGGTVSFTRSRMGGVRVGVIVPLTAAVQGEGAGND